MSSRLRPGDILEIPLPNGGWAYAQYLLLSKMGPIIQVLDRVSPSRQDAEDLIGAAPLFPPVIAGVHSAVKAAQWKVIGRLPVQRLEHPRFVSTLYDQETGKARLWFLWDGTRDARIGPSLPQKYKTLEFLVVWNPADVATRIETGIVPFPYSDLIKNNRFVPRPRE